VKDTDFFVAGAGSWGTALAVLLARNGCKVGLWERAEDRRAILTAQRVNQRYLPDVPFPAKLFLAQTLAQSSAAHHILIVVPSTGFRETVVSLAPYLSAEAAICWGTKGLEQNSLLLPHQIIAQELGVSRLAAVISGPSFAGEIAQGLPAAVTISAQQMQYAEQLSALLRNEYLRVYPGTDMIGTQIGAAAKNVIAIAAGIADGLGFGANARAALVTRGLHEIMRLGVTLGGKTETFMGLAGLGDLMLTCTDNQSRNHRFGLALGQGASVQQALLEVGQVVEGYHTAQQIVTLAHQHHVEMPISQQVLAVVQETMTPLEAVKYLLARDPKPEHAENFPPSR